MSDMTDAQRQAVETEARDVLVIAGAGSGKTRILVARILHLIQERGVSLSEIMCLTFTRKAAGEMLNRLLLESSEDSQDPQRALRGMLIGTFHSVALRILRTHGDRLGYDPETMTVVDPHDANALLLQVCKDLGYCDDKGKVSRLGLSWKAITDYRERYYCTGSHGEGGAPLSILNEYHTRLYELNLLDYGMILVQCRRLLHEHPDVLQSYRDRITHVLVDELQDSDTVQYNLHDFFAPPAAFFGVGDRRQSIYGFRGARPDLMTERHPNAEIIDLQECFRCGDRIIDAANRLISVNGDKLAKPMIGATGRESVVVRAYGRSADLVNFVENIAYFERCSWAEIAVMARSHRTLKRLADICEEKRVPYHRVGSNFDICETEKFREVHAVLRLMVNRRDNLAFLLLRDALGIDPERYADIRSHAARHHFSHWDGYLQMAGLPDGDPWHIANYHMYHHEAAIAEKPSWRIAQALPRATPAEIVAFWVEHCGDLTVPEALDWYAHRDSQDDLKPGDHVTLLTVHAAKGLEWPIVIVANLNEGNFPSSQAIRAGNEAIQEERRLAYVAITRAQNYLALHYRRSEDQSAKGKKQRPSRFLQESGVSHAIP